MPTTDRSRIFQVLAAMFISLVCLSACRSNRPLPVANRIAPAPERIGWIVLERPHPAATPLLSVEPEKLPEHVAGLYRVIPDRRFLYAVGEIARLAAGKRIEGTIGLRFESGFWKLTWNGGDVGSLPEIPTYADAARLLAAWSGRQKLPVRPAASAVSSADLARLDTDLGTGSRGQVLAALERLDESWKAHPWDSGLLRAAVRGYVWLSVQTWDELHLADPLAGKALALLVLARGAGATDLDGEEALLCSVMGYETAAIAAAKSLPESDPVRLYVTFDTKALGEAADKTRAPRSEYLHLLRLADARDRDAWFRRLGRTSWGRRANSAAFRATLGLNDFQSTRQISQATTIATFLEATGAPAGPELSMPSDADASSWPDMALGRVFAAAKGHLTASPESQFPAFENAVRERASARLGPILDRESLTAYFVAPFYSSVHEMARFLFDSLGSTPAAEKYFRTFGEAPPGAAAELKTWMADRIAIRNGKGNALEIANRTFSHRHLGIVPLSRMRYSVSLGITAMTDPVVRAPVKVLFERLDTRPEGLEEAEALSDWNLLDLRSREKYLRAVAEMAPRSSAGKAVQLAFLSGDFGRLRAIASDAALPVGPRSSALESLRRLKQGDTAFLRDRYLELMDLEPENTRPMNDCVALLESSGDLPGAEEVARRWIRARGGKEDLHWAHAVEVEARLLQSEGKLDSAWLVIKPALSTGKSDVMLRGASILADLGRQDEALGLARQHLERYPEGDDGYVAVADILWRQRKNIEAAEILEQAETRHWVGWPYPGGKAFARAFAQAPVEDGERAFEALMARKLPHYRLAPISRAAGDAGNHELAFRTLSRLKTTGAEATAINLWAFDELEKTKGRDAALAWLRGKLAPSSQLAIVLFQHEHFSLLWDLFPEGSPVDKDDAVQLLRAAALLHMHEGSGPRRDALIAYFEKKPRVDLPLYGLYLMEKADRKELVTKMKDMSYVTTRGWILGLKAASDGRYEEASSWLQVAVETGERQLPPHALAVGILLDWRGANQLLSGLAAKRVI